MCMACAWLLHGMCMATACACACACAYAHCLQAELAGLFSANFTKYASECTPEVVACGPKA
jgi:hypothetical protein